MLSRDTMMEGDAGSGDGRGMSRWRLAAWTAAALLLLVPLIAGAPWSAGDFVFAGILLFGSLGLFEIVVRASSDAAYRAGAGLAIAGSFLLLWVNGAVGITDSDADVLYLGVVGVGIVGALVARLRPAGMARAMLAAALTLVLIATGALIAGIIPPHNSAFEILALTALFVLPFGGSALLFRTADWENPEREASTDAGDADEEPPGETCGP